MAYQVMAAGANAMLKNLTTLKSTLQGSNGSKKSSLSFDKVMDQNKQVSSAKEEIQEKQQPAAAKNQKVNQQTTDKLQTNADDQTDAVNQNKEVSELDSAESIGEEPMDALKETLSKLKKEICDILDITEEQLDGMLEQLGLTMFDLLQPENISLLVMEYNNTTDPSLFLTDETAANAYKKILEAVNLQKEQLEQKTQIPVQELVDAAKQSMAEQKTKDLEESDAKTTTEKSDQKEIPVTVVSSKEGEETVKNEGNKKEFAQQDQSFAKQQEAKTPGEQFLQNLSNAFVKESASEQQIEQVTPIREIAGQIIEQVKVVIRPEQTSMEMQLNPEHLGKVNLNITSKNGVMTAQFLTQTQVAKEAIESQVQILRETLEQQGIKVEAIEVNVSEYAFQRNTESGEKENQQEKSKRRQFLQMDDTVEQKEEEQINPVPDLTGSSVNYTA